MLIDKCTDRQNPLGRLCISLCVAAGDVSSLWMMSAGRVDLPPQDKRHKASRANETHKKTGQVKKISGGEEVRILAGGFQDERRRDPGRIFPIFCLMLHSELLAKSFSPLCI